MSGLPGVIRERILAFGASAPWHQGGQTLPEFERGQDDMSSSILIGAFQFRNLDSREKAVTPPAFFNYCTPRAHR